MTPNRSTTGQRRGLEASALTGLVPLIAVIPVWLVALFPVWLVVQTVWEISFFALALGHLASSVVLFIRPLQVLILGRLLGARPPTIQQAARLEPAWNMVLQANKVPRGRYVVMVLPSNEINAYACGGHLVVVTSYAVESLPKAELSGVLAHELSHHLGFHTVALTVMHWLGAPVWLLARLGFTLNNVATAATSSFVSHSAALTAIGRLLSAVLTAVSWVLLSGLWISTALSNVVGRRSEFQADQRAIDMGFGQPLASALRRVSATSGGATPIGWRERLAVTHPSARLRTARIDAALRSRGQRTRPIHTA